MLGFTLACGMPGQARADPISAASLLQQSTLVINQQSNVYAFTAPGPGMLVVQLDDIVWPSALQSLDLSINSPTNVLGAMSLDGSMTLAVSHAGNYYADVTGIAGGPLAVGLYSLQIDFMPQAAPVPLPAALALMLAGLAMLGVLHLRARRAERALPDLGTGPVPHSP